MSELRRMRRENRNRKKRHNGNPASNHPLEAMGRRRNESTSHIFSHTSYIPCIHTLSFMGDGAGPCEFQSTYAVPFPLHRAPPFNLSLSLSFSTDHFVPRFSRFYLLLFSSLILVSYFCIIQPNLFASSFFDPQGFCFCAFCAGFYCGVRKPVFCLESDTSMVNVTYTFIERI